jgi:hypothetical protein
VKRFMTIKRFLVALVLMASSLPATSHAGAHFDVLGAGSFRGDNYPFINSPSLLAGADFTYGMLDLFELGAVYNHNFLSYTFGGSDSLNFYGGIIRSRTMVGLFGDLQAGIAKRGGLDPSFSWGVGAGYAIPFGIVFDLSPRVGYRSVPDAGTTRSLIDVGLLFTFKLL